MDKNIVLDISDVVNEQTASKAKRFKVGVLAVSVLILATLTIVAWNNLPNYTPLAAIGVAILISAITYSIPGRRERKFLKPFIKELKEELDARGYTFADSVSNKNFKPWLSSQSAYLYGDGLVLRKSLSRGLKMRTLKFTVDDNDNEENRKRKLTVERLTTGKSTIIKVVSADGFEVRSKNQAENETSHSKVSENRQAKITSTEFNSSLPEAWDKNSLT